MSRYPEAVADRGPIFTRRAMTAIAAIPLLFAIIMSSAHTQPALDVATAEKTAVATLAAPSQSAGMFLDVGVRGFTPPKNGAGVAAVVTLAGKAGPEHPVGQFSIFPLEPFVAKNVREERTFRLDASAALEAVGLAGPLTVRVRLAPVDGSSTTEGVELALGHVAFVARP